MQKNKKKTIFIIFESDILSDITKEIRNKSIKIKLINKISFIYFFFFEVLKMKIIKITQFLILLVK